MVLGRGGFADDRAPPDCLVAVPDGHGGWAVGETLAEARAAAGKVQGRRSGQRLRYPLEVPPGDWDLTLQTTWVEPAYLEPDASWCVPGGEPAHPAGNGGAFGGKVGLGRPRPRPGSWRTGTDGRCGWSFPGRTWCGSARSVRPSPPACGRRDRGDPWWPRPGVAGGHRGRRPRAARSIEVAGVAGPPVSAAIRAAGWAEAAVLLAAAEPLADGPGARRRRGRLGPAVIGPGGGWAEAAVTWTRRAGRRRVG